MFTDSCCYISHRHWNAVVVVDPAAVLAEQGSPRRARVFAVDSAYSPDSTEKSAELGRLAKDVATFLAKIRLACEPLAKHRPIDECVRIETRTFVRMACLKLLAVRTWTLITLDTSCRHGNSRTAAIAGSSPLWPLPLSLTIRKRRVLCCSRDVTATRSASIDCGASSTRERSVPLFSPKRPVRQYSSFSTPESFPLSLSFSPSVPLLAVANRRAC